MDGTVTIKGQGKGLHNSYFWELVYSLLLLLPDGYSVKEQVRVPRLKGEKKGVFATRSPHRPSPIGLTVAKASTCAFIVVYSNAGPVIGESAKAREQRIETSSSQVYWIAENQKDEKTNEKVLSQS